MYDRILIPLDGSTLSEAVLPHAEEVARRFSSQVTLLQVIPLTHLMGAGVDPAFSAGATASQLQTEFDAATKYLEDVGARLRDAGLNVHTATIEGQPAAAILDFAKTHDFLLIAMSSHGRGGIGRLMHGSVADELMRNSHLPLLLIRPDKH